MASSCCSSTESGIYGTIALFAVGLLCALCCAGAVVKKDNLKWLGFIAPSLVMPMLLVHAGFWAACVVEDSSMEEVYSVSMLVLGVILSLWYYTIAFFATKDQECAKGLPVMAAISLCITVAISVTSGYAIETLMRGGSILSACDVVEDTVPNITIDTNVSEPGCCSSTESDNYAATPVLVTFGIACLLCCMGVASECDNSGVWGVSTKLLAVPVLLVNDGFSRPCTMTSYHVEVAYSAVMLMAGGLQTVCCCMIWTSTAYVDGDRDWCIAGIACCISVAAVAAAGFQTDATHTRGDGFFSSPDNVDTDAHNVLSDFCFGAEPSYYRLATGTTAVSSCIVLMIYASERQRCSVAQKAAKDILFFLLLPTLLPMSILHAISRLTCVVRDGSAETIFSAAATTLGVIYTLWCCVCGYQQYQGSDSGWNKPRAAAILGVVTTVTYSAYTNAGCWQSDGFGADCLAATSSSSGSSSLHDDSSWQYDQPWHNILSQRDLLLVSNIVRWIIIIFVCVVVDHNTRQQVGPGDDDTMSCPLADEAPVDNSVANAPLLLSTHPNFIRAYVFASNALALLGATFVAATQQRSTTVSFVQIGLVAVLLGTVLFNHNKTPAVMVMVVTSVAIESLTGAELGRMVPTVAGACMVHIGCAGLAGIGLSEN
eukprot:COSAG02_NODE_8171_length_2678_cov_2.196588_1_plen_655_part_10